MPAPPGCGKVDLEKHFLALAHGHSMNGGKYPILDGDLLLLERITANNADSITNTTIAIERYLLVARNPEYAVMKANEEFVTFA
ncbi:hypothetical protein [Pseudoalteromonas maricaloris]|uniref:hypothetical protein n=2 Tax=Pseudoalteromonas TaxID=53246 RepID=UPI00029B23D1|nr:hypothetical protein [Pseudoalteromonas flavipulchra]